jgi:2,3-bisphosphoglycerate-independent phosphoglycerate mutase
MLMILDGWGVREESIDNAIAQARTPHYDQIRSEYPFALLDASGKAVGLPAGIMGNSEVGHLNIGAGRIAKVGLTRIYQAIEDGSFFRNPVLLQAFQAAKQKKSKLHLMGLVSDGAVHSHQDHLYALLRMAKEQGVDRVFIHSFQDGRDTDPKSGAGYVGALEEKIHQIGIGKIRRSWVVILPGSGTLERIAAYRPWWKARGGRPAARG